jgi:hypothetical protein
MVLIRARTRPCEMVTNQQMWRQHIRHSKHVQQVHKVPTSP